MADPNAVKRELSRLAAGESVPDDPPRRAGATPDERVVRRAVRAVEDVDRAAAFRRAEDLPPLRRSVEVAERVGERDVARSGQRALAAFEWFDRAATGGRTPRR